MNETMTKSQKSSKANSSPRYLQTLVSSQPLENIGFYTLEDARAKNTSKESPLWRCELILTNACNFKCPYCRGLNGDLRKTMSFKKAKLIVDLWAKDGLKNIRFSGGEPTLYNQLSDLIRHTKSAGIKRIAISTNGSADFEYYEYLYECGVNDFSISLDSCCAATGDKMAGGICGSWKKVTENILKISKLTYTTVGIVINKENILECVDTIKLADSLGVSDIRVIPSAQYNQLLKVISKIPVEIISKYPILKYRVNNVINGRNVRGIKKTDSRRCPLVLDDMAIAGEYHFPCIIYLREHGEPIGKIGNKMRGEREKWYKNHDVYDDRICRENCLDVCIDYNNKVAELNNELGY
jgi:MoaA/NifB/PqqE/SkfB family radical SAM enzyme